MIAGIPLMDLEIMTEVRKRNQQTADHQWLQNQWQQRWEKEQITNQWTKRLIPDIRKWVAGSV